MGCTMHAHIEVKRDGRWLHYGAPDVQRDYIVFAVISGERIDSFRKSTREQIIPQASVKGLPDNMSEVTEFCYQQDKEGVSVHGEGVLTAEDLKNLQKHLNELSERWCGRRCTDYDLEEGIFKTYINGNTIALHQGWDDVRIVFWYDN